MHTEFKKADPVREMRSLLLFDRAVFRAADRFPRDYWLQVVSYWMLIDHNKVGCCAFERNVDFQQDVREDGANVPTKGSLYIATTGIHPRFQGLGLGRVLKYWQICYARQHRYRRIVTNMRKSNAAIVALNTELGFRPIRTTPRYYAGPVDATVVMELRLP